MRGVRWYLVGSVVLATLAGCKLSFEEREPWRRQAEEACIKGGNVKQGPAVVLIEPISGPGVCGADFPLKVGEIGEQGPLGYADEAVRPPGDVPQGGQAEPIRARRRPIRPTGPLIRPIRRMSAIRRRTARRRAIACRPGIRATRRSR